MAYNPDEQPPLEPFKEEIEVDEPDPIDDPLDYREERERARVLVPNKLVMAIMMLLLILLIASALGVSINIFGPSGKNLTQKNTPLPATRILNPGGSGVVNGLGNGETNVDGQSSGNISTPGAGGQPTCTVHPIFRPYWEQHGAERIFGFPISDMIEINGRRFQWFERARLEEWTEYAGQEHHIQPGLVGREFTDGRDFPRQVHFVNRSDLWYFPETEHAIGGVFLDFWLQNGGLDIFGYPISEEILETLPSDGLIHRVQYFERARFEYHPARAGTEDEVMLGLLGRSLYPQTSKPSIVDSSLVAPTAVPQP